MLSAFWSCIPWKMIRASAGGLDALVENSEQVTNAVLLDLVLDEKLGRLRQRLLHLTDAEGWR
jgi:hypothetical protein